MRQVLGALFAVLALATVPSTAAEPWTGADPSRRPRMLGAGDIDFAVAELCFPFIVQNADVATITVRPLVVRMPRPPAFAAESGGWMVGKASTVVAFIERDGGRTCTISIEDGDPDELRAALQVRLDQLAPMTPAARQLPPNTYARREVRCGPPSAPHYAVLISTKSLQRRGPKIMVSLQRSAARNPGCDAPLSPPESPPPPAPATTL